MKIFYQLIVYWLSYWTPLNFYFLFAWLIIIHSIFIRESAFYSTYEFSVTHASYIACTVLLYQPSSRAEIFSISFIALLFSGTVIKRTVVVQFSKLQIIWSEMRTVKYQWDIFTNASHCVKFLSIEKLRLQFSSTCFLVKDENKPLSSEKERILSSNCSVNFVGVVKQADITIDVS